jgi:hypothetical protein
MPAQRSSLLQYVLPSLVLTAMLVGGLEAASASYAAEGIRECGRSFDPCVVSTLVAEAETPAQTVAERSLASQDAPAVPAAVAARTPREV